jgi:hypothetical protein
MRIEREHRWNGSLQEPDLTASIPKECVGREGIVYQRDFETLQSVTSQPSEQGARIELGEIQAIEIGAKSEVSIQTVVRKGGLRWHLDDRNGSHQIEITVKYGLIRKTPHSQDGVDELDSVVDVPRLSDTPTLNRHRRANLGKRCRLHTKRLLEIDDRSAEKSRQMKVCGLEAVNNAGCIRCCCEYRCW